MGIPRILGITVVGLAAQVASVCAESRVALIIGNAAYQNVAQLNNPINDASLIAAALETDGFDVTVAHNLGHDSLLKALRDFRARADGADWAVVYYAGHGIEMAGANHLIPVDARLAEDRDVPDETVSLDRVLATVEGVRSMKLIILDACRNNPFVPGMKTSGGAGRAIGRGLARIEPRTATLVVYSAEAGSIAADGDGANSPFATALAKRLIEPGVEVNKMLRLVRDDVLEATDNKQNPFVYGSSPGREDFFFRPLPMGSAVVGSEGGSKTSLPQSSVEMVFWQSIEKSPHAADFQAYLEKFPDGVFTRLAETRIVALAEPIILTHDDRISSADFSPDGGRIATSSFDRTGKLWDAVSGNLIATLKGHTDSLWSVRFSPNGHRILTASHDKTAKIWDGTTGHLLATLEGHTGTVLSGTFSPDGTRLVTISADQTIRLWVVGSGQLITTLERPPDYIGAAFSPDGNRILTWGKGNAARLWDPATGRLLATLDSSSGWVFAAYSPDGRRIVTAHDKTARLWETASGRLLASLQGHTDRVYGAAFAPDGTRIVTRAEDNAAMVWDTASGNLLATLDGHTKYIMSAEFSWDGSRILTGSDDGTARMWDTASGRLLATLEGRLATFSPDGRLIVTFDLAGAGSLWDAHSGRVVAKLKGRVMRFSPDGSRMVLISDSTARVWEVDAVIAEAAIHAGK